MPAMVKICCKAQKTSQGVGKTRVQIGKSTLKNTKVLMSYLKIIRGMALDKRLMQKLVKSIHSAYG
ncbi:Uncharacterised protein [Streptococcus pneumoniae]|nr:Uncharacterised protein [Streptococcus pneumoniae]CAG5451382.1 Uncharacterised protein [Streptococcus pneumoniae]CAG5681106.1 Uncharacterised protein [Streptococcus pneumoniae]